MKRFILPVLAFASCMLASADSPPLYVDSKAIRERFDTITPDDMAMLRTKKILWASRSFGLNTLGGLTTLAKQNKIYNLQNAYQRFDVFKAGGDLSIIPTNAFSTANIVHFLATVHPFTKRVDEVDWLLHDPPHHFAKDVDAVIVFYHMATPETFRDYAAKMEAMRAASPHIRFIFVTAGFMGPARAKDNEASHAFSEMVRARYMGKVPLYDMGKILSDDFRAGHVYCPEYSKDPADVHPNLPAGETMLAKGFLLVLRDAFKAPARGTETFDPLPPASAKAKPERIAANHPDAIAVRAILDANGLDRKTVDGVSVIERGRITKLYLQECGVTNLTDDIGKLTSLKLLHVYGDRKLPHPLLQHVSPAIAQCRQLEELLLTQNALASLPMEITKLKNLKSLSIGENHLTHLPPAILEWVKQLDPKGLSLQE